MDSTYLILAILIAASATILTRFMPFFIFDKKEKPSKTLLLFEKFMPLMIMMILIFYAIKDTKFYEFPYGIPEFFCIGLTFFLHVRFKNVLLSILCATISYMIIIQVLIPFLQYNI